MGKQMRLLFSAIAIGVGLTVTASTASAQDGSTTGTQRGGRGEGRSRMGGGNVFRVALELQGITADQKEKIEKLQTDLRGKMEEARKAQTNKTPDANAAGGGRGGWNNPEMQKMMKDARAEVEKILTDEQKKELETKMAAARARGGNRETTGTAPSNP